MNKITATVKAIEETGVVTYIRVENGETSINLIKSNAPEWLGVGDRVCCMFQEASVCVSKECPGRVSIENRLPGTLKSVRKNASLCELTFECELGKVVSLITEHAYESMGLEQGCRATMLLRGVDINLEPVVEPMGEEIQRRLRTKDAFTG
jgi:molybdate transport system regulatory protein